MLGAVGVWWCCEYLGIMLVSWLEWLLCGYRFCLVRLVECYDE